MKIISIREAAQRMQVSHDSIYRLIRSGKIKAERVTPTSPHRVIEESLEEYAAQNHIVLLPPTAQQLEQ